MNKQVQQIYIYNSLTRKKEVFEPIQRGLVRMYTCGVTVYDQCHIGHARTYIAFDTVVRFFKYMGYRVTLVRNITDIDDKIIKRAQQNHQSTQALVDHFTNKMYEDFDALNISRPDFEPKATQTIPEMIDFIQTLIHKGYAYVADSGNVYFRVQRFSNYGRLSNQHLASLISGARVESSDEKEDPLDFTLWKVAKPDEPQWSSPWAPGRPGWHIECSAMAKKILGETFDIHAGGADLKFPHHENEIAQSEACNEQTFANYWMHSGMVQVNAEKMSKSLNNFFTISEVLKQYHPEVVRYFLISGHYRSEVNYSDENLEQAKNAVIKLYTALRGLNDVSESSDGTGSEEKAAFIKAMSDDFNVPEALAQLFALAKKLNIARSEQDMVLANQYGSLLRELGGILGILQYEPDQLLKTINMTENDDIDDATIEKLVAERVQARNNKQWKRADQIRDYLSSFGVLLEDSKTTSTWRRE